MASSAPPSPASPVDAARDAWDHTRRQLFPIRFERWLVLGLLAFLDQCGRTFRGGGGVSGRGHDWVPGHPPLPGDIVPWLQRAGEWLSLHAVLVAVGGLGVVALVALVAAAVLWLNSRGVFLYLDAVATGRTDVARPWREHASAASSYFGWSLGLSLAGLFVMLFAGGLVAALALGFASGRLGGGGLTVLATLPVLLLLLLALPALALAAVALRDFVAPLQLATGLPCGAAARVLEGLVVAQPGVFVLYLLIKLVVVVASGLVIALGGCLTCCIGFLPILMHTVFQPLFHFERGISLFLLRRLGHDVAGRLVSLR